MNPKQSSAARPLCAAFPGMPLQTKRRPRRWWILGFVVLVMTLLWALDPMPWNLFPLVWGVLAASVFVTRSSVDRVLPAARSTSVLTFAPQNESIVRNLLALPKVDVRTLEGSRITTSSDLAAALDDALGPFTYPSDPAARIAAHLAHERRGSGERVLLWRDADRLRRADRAAFDRFLTDWERAMHRAGVHRTLLVDLGIAAAA